MLDQRGCQASTDHAYSCRPPPEGWQAWMHGCIRRADIVLVVCTPKLKQRYEKTAAPDTGRGATFEGAIVTQHIYDDAMRNDKFYPILPDGGSEDDIPTTLKPWWNGHRFPSGYEGIRRMIFDETPEADLSATATSYDSQTAMSPKRFDTHQQKLANRSLAADGAKSFYEALKRELADEFPAAAIPQSTPETVAYFVECPAEQVQQLFYVVRRALLALPPTEAHDSRKSAEEAAAALYCLAACRLVNEAALKADSGSGSYVFQVPSSERVICAIIATALFGGELRLLPAEADSGLPRPEYVFEVNVPASGNLIVEDFERAVYAALFPNKRETTYVSLEAGALDGERRAQLESHFDDIKYVHRGSLALVIHGLVQTSACSGFASRYQVPVMLPATEVTTALLGMNVHRLTQEIQKLWESFTALRSASQHQASSHPPPGASAMSSSGITVQVSGGSANIALNTGDRSAAQAGNHNAAHQAHREGADLSELAPLLHELAEAINALASPKAREALTPHAQAAQAEAAKPDRPDPGLVKRALDAIKPAAEVLEGGEKIATLCNQGYRLLAPFLGLPNLPLP